MIDSTLFKQTLLQAMNESYDEKPYVVSFGYDIGGPESGPIIRSGSDIVYATSEQEACDKWEKECADFEGYCGCMAHEATSKEIEEIEADRAEAEERMNWALDNWGI